MFFPWVADGNTDSSMMQGKIVDTGDKKGRLSVIRLFQKENTSKIDKIHWIVKRRIVGYCMVSTSFILFSSIEGESNDNEKSIDSPYRPTDVASRMFQ